MVQRLLTLLDLLLGVLEPVVGALQLVAQLVLQLFQLSQLQPVVVGLRGFTVALLVQLQ